MCPCIPQFTMYKWGKRGYLLHGHVFLTDIIYLIRILILSKSPNKIHFRFTFFLGVHKTFLTCIQYLHHLSTSGKHLRMKATPDGLASYNWGNRGLVWNYRLLIFASRKRYILGINEVIITDTQNLRFYGQQLMQKYNQNQLYFRILYENGDVSVMKYE